MPPVSERMRIQFAKFLIVICNVLDLRADGNKEKIAQLFNEYNPQEKIPGNLSFTSKFDDVDEKINKSTSAFFQEVYGSGVDPSKSKSRIEILETDLFNLNRRHNNLLTVFMAFLKCSWWQKLLGVGPKKRTFTTEQEKTAFYDEWLGRSWDR